MVEYDHTTYGKVTVLKNTNELADINLFRYKGYYYDSESGMHYCQSRYYVPEWSRRLNNYEFSSIQDTSSREINLYCYCNNNAVTKIQKTRSSVRKNVKNASSEFKTGWVAEATADYRGARLFVGYDSNKSSNPISWLQNKLFYAEGSEVLGLR